MATTTTHETFGTTVSVPVKRAVKSKYRRRAGFVYPLIGNFTTVTGGSLQENYSQGSYFSPAYGPALIRNNLRQLLLCEKGERVMLPDYGVSIRKFLFEPLDEITFFLIRTEVLRALSKYFSIVRVVNLGVFSTDQYVAKNQIIIRLTLQILDESLDIFDVEVNIG
jgi:phage baseplate assembly protein W